MPSSSDASQPWFNLRRDFADELGFGDFLLENQRIETVGSERQVLNAQLSLSPALPRYLAYFMSESGTEAYITADFTDYYSLPMNGLFEDLVGRLDASVKSSVFLQAATMGVKSQASLAAGQDERPGYVIVHDTHTSDAYFWPANEDTVRFLREQP
jgi:hypothetical protein